MRGEAQGEADLVIGILGGGLSGLALASELKRPCEVLERADRAGGLLRTYSWGGFSADVGGHILFSRDQVALDWMVGKLGANVERRERANCIAVDGHLVRYPFENNLAALGPAAAAECLLGYLAAKHEPPCRSLDGWVRGIFGEAIAERYLLPYNRKVWKLDPRELSPCWVERIPRPPVEDVVRSACGGRTEGYQHQARFWYPKHGGIEALARALAVDVGPRLVLGHAVHELRRAGSGWLVDGEREYSELVSTLPMGAVLAMLPSVPGGVLDAARALRWNALRVVVLGIDRREGLDELTAIYDASPRTLAHRTCFPCAFSPTMAPEGGGVVAAEVTCRPGDRVYEMSDEELSDRVRADLLGMGVLRTKDRVLERFVIREPIAYVVPDHAYLRAMDVVGGYLRSIGIRPLGRLGSWRYLNMDECVRDAMALARELDS
jgi:protoporphyrinogen oxidase